MKEGAGTVTGTGTAAESWDAVVIGAGHNGLVTAAYLARAGLRTLVLERRDRVGGAATTEEFAPGFRCDSGAHRLSGLRPAVLRDLGLADHGLELLRPDPAVFAPLPDGRHLILRPRPEDSVETIRALSPVDAGRWLEFTRRVSRIRRFLERVHATEPPQLAETDRRDLRTLLKLAGRLRLGGRQRVIDLLRWLPMSITGLLDEWFQNDALRGALAADGITGLFLGPREAGTAHHFLHRQAWTDGTGPRSPLRVRGGMSALADALAAAARAHGAEIRTEAPVSRIRVRNGRAVAVVLEDGEEITAARIASSADPAVTFLGLVDPTELEASFLAGVKNIRFRAACAKVHLALAELPRFPAAPDDGGAHLRGLISIAPSTGYLQRAYDDAKYGAVSERPYLEAVIPSLQNPELAPAGKHVMSVLAQYVPYRLRSGDSEAPQRDGGRWDAARRTELGDRVVEALAEYAPDLPAAIEAREVLTPRDLEERFALTEGDLYHGTMMLDQLYVLRPLPGWARYRTPIEGLYLCGAGTHPGGGISGSSGFNAAARILREVGTRNIEYRTRNTE